MAPLQPTKQSQRHWISSKSTAILRVGVCHVGSHRLNQYPDGGAKGLQNSTFGWCGQPSTAATVELSAKDWSDDISIWLASPLCADVWLCIRLSDRCSNV